MIVTVGLIAVAGMLLLNLPIGAAILLGAVLAPTDPVLASDVQLEHPGDRDRLRFGLTGEAGLNDGTAFPFVMLGLGLLGLHEMGELGWRWMAVDLIWAVGAGLGIGAILGTLTGKFVVSLRQKEEETFGRDEFIALGLIGFSYGLAIFAHAYGFLAVFAAGLALRRFERKTSGLKEAPEPEENRQQLDQIDETGRTSVQVAGAVLGANEQLERLLEVGIVLLAGAMITRSSFTTDVVWFAPLLFMVIRPAAVLLGTIGCRATGIQKALLCWFGIRGIGSLYYMMYAVQHGLSQDLAEKLTNLVVSLVVISVLVHGVSVSPIMRRYEQISRRKDKAA
jgi:NhaP-type Na+/H+ or K+/H+ antiporter